jgi:hypothetical protein
MIYSENPIGVEQPVRFYKIVAITFLILTLVLFGVIIFMSSKRAVVTIVTKNDVVDISTRIKIGSIEHGADIAGTSTTTMITYKDSFSPTGSKQEEGIATGFVTLHNDSNSSQPLVATTRLLNEDDVLFRLKDRIVVPANGEIRAEVYADEKGIGGDILPQEKFIIPGLNVNRQKEVYASSDESMSGGLAQVGVLSSDDLRKAEKELEEKLLEEGMALFADNTAIVNIIQKTIESDTDVGNEIAKFTLTGKATIVATMYDVEELNEWATKALKKREISDDEIVHPSYTDPTVTFDEYDAVEGIAIVQVFQDGLATLNPESPTLQKNMFLGKTKDEVRHYLLPLDHVHEVDVEFSPAWIRKVPFISEHVTVVVKEV